MSEPASLAVVVASPVPSGHPNDVLAGLTLALRAVLTLQKEGVSRVLLVVPDDEPEVVTRVCLDRRITIPVDVVPSEKAADLANEIDEPFVLARHDLVAAPGIYKALMRAELGGATGLVAARDGEPIGPLLGTRALFDAGIQGSVSDWLAGIATQDNVQKLDVGTLWSTPVTSKEGRERAFFELFEACRKPVDGLVARHINRHISIFISKRIVHTPLTPNMMSAITFLLGIGGAYSCAQGGYWGMLVGAFLFQWNSILDGVDGELARVRFQQSKLGQWIDTVSDDVSNIAFYIGITLGARGLPGDHILMWIGALGTVAFTLQMTVLYVELVEKGSGDLYAIDWDFDKTPPPGLKGKLLVFFRYALKKDFAILFFLAMAVLGVLPYMLPIIAGGAIGTLIAAVKRRYGQKAA